MTAEAFTRQRYPYALFFGVGRHGITLPAVFQGHERFVLSWPHRRQCCHAPHLWAGRVAVAPFLPLVLAFYGGRRLYNRVKK